MADEEEAKGGKLDEPDGRVAEVEPEDETVREDGGQEEAESDWDNNHYNEKDD